MGIFFFSNNLNILLSKNIWLLEHLLLILLLLSLYLLANTTNLLKVILILELSSLYSEILLVVVSFQTCGAEGYINTLFYMSVVAAESAVLLTLLLVTNFKFSGIKINKM